MTKKIFAILLVIGIVGSALVGCAPKAEETTTGTGTTAGADASTTETK